mmetsp:Transcript_20690/g.24296  ORF Transcript_20690/g.24296 Transcript_20690/m.24296 type:complete len:81 (+) Transcript_20690:890-1132(+)
MNAFEVFLLVCLGDRCFLLDFELHCCVLRQLYRPRTFLVDNDEEIKAACELLARRIDDGVDVCIRLCLGLLINFFLVAAL